MTKEQVQNIQDAQSDPESEEGRARSSIQFPYNDLNNVVEIAKAVHDNAGTECTLDQLAAYLKQSMTSGAFRLRVSTASMYGLTENERGKVRLTPLGRRITDPSQEIGARGEAFLAVPLYSRIYENFKGYTLPGAAALEKFIRDAGVSSKVSDKARQVFLRSARQAGFFEHGEDRLVRPAPGPGPGTKPVEAEAPTQEPEQKRKGGGGGDFGDQDALIIGLFRKLPAPEDEWGEEDRLKWLQTAANIFDLVYKGDCAGFVITPARAERSPRPRD